MRDGRKKQKKEEEEKEGGISGGGMGFGSCGGRVKGRGGTRDVRRWSWMGGVRAPCLFNCLLVLVGFKRDRG